MENTTTILEKNIRVVIGLNDNYELFIRDLSRSQEVELCRYDTEKLFELLKDKKVTANNSSFIQNCSIVRCVWNNKLGLCAMKNRKDYDKCLSRSPK